MEMKMDFLVLALAALVPLIIGFLWYSKMLFANAWMNSAGLSEENLKGGNMAMIFGLTYLFSFFLATAIQFMVIHQYSVFSIFADTPEFKDPTSELGMWAKDFFDKYGSNFRTFKHGVAHGVLSGIFFVLPVVGINALFERRSFKYIFIHTGFWTVTLALMGGIICQFASAY